MDDINQPTRFEHLPPEMILLIFDYLPGDDILKSFLNLNIRFNTLIKTARLNTIDLSRWTRKEIMDLFKGFMNPISTYCLSLKLANSILNDGYCSANIEFIFSSLLDLNQLKYLLQNLQQITFIRPIIDTTICFPDIILQSFIIYSLNNKIVFKKNISQNNINSIVICSNELMRSLLVDNGGIYNQRFVNFNNPVINQIIPLVRHLKLYIDNYNQQWLYMSPFIVNTIAELTLLITDNEFQYYDGIIFSSLFQNISNHCRLNFYLQFIPELSLPRRNIDTLVQSFQSIFYIEHQSNVTIAYSRDFRSISNHSLLIYTSPFCGSKLALMDNQEIFGLCSDYTNLTRLIFDPCCHNYAGILPPHNQMNLLLPNLTSLEFIHTSAYNFNQILMPFNNIFQHTTPQIRHLHFRHRRCVSYLIQYILPFYTFNHLRYLDITDSHITCSILHAILLQHNFCTNIFHLNISGLCRLQNDDIKDISKNFLELQTLKFSIEFISSFNEQLDTIGEFILFNMRSHLHYLHIVFEQGHMSMTPTENQLSEWLGNNQRRFLHVQAIELNRSELSAWM